MIQVKKIQKLVQIEQTLFSLPLALAAVALAFWSQENLKTMPVNELLMICFWVAIAVFSGRTAGMSLNQLIDCKIDANNPRTKNRLIPAGVVSKKNAILLITVSYIIFFSACFAINPLCFMLSPLVALVLFAYSFLKRFTALCHFGMGLVHFFVPICAWVAITGEYSIEALYFGLAAFCRIAGSDILYAFQDYEFDKSYGVYSIPSVWGKSAALVTAGVLFAGTAAFLVMMGIASELSPIYYVGIALLTAVLGWQWKEVLVKGASGITKTFFSCNTLFPMLLFLFVLLGLL